MKECHLFLPSQACRASSVERGVDAGLGDSHSLLLHHLRASERCGNVHLRELRPSNTSWIATRSASVILSNSSTQQTPRSARTIAPACEY